MLFEYSALEPATGVEFTTYSSNFTESQIVRISIIMRTFKAIIKKRCTIDLKIHFYSLLHN